MAETSSSRARNPEQTRAALIAAAREEFEDPGYELTHTNRIARRAGYAPQTFYRHFTDKTAIFLAVYEQWVKEELGLLDHVRGAYETARIIGAHHKASVHFRRSLRHLSLTEPAIRAARSASRRHQIERLRERLPHLQTVADATLAASLLTIERLADAYAEDEFTALGISEEAALKEIEHALSSAFGTIR